MQMLDRKPEEPEIEAATENFVSAPICKRERSQSLCLRVYKNIRFYCHPK
jgi:hypothetical protein